MKPHKWAKEIKCFINGGEVERKNINENEWLLIKDIGEFSIDYMDFRIKPQPKEPQYLYAYFHDGGALFSKELNETFKHRYIGKIKLEDESE